MERVIKNFDTLAKNELRRDALEIAETGYDAINVENAIKRELKIENDELRIKNNSFTIAGRKIYFIGIGKCASIAAKAIEGLLGEQLAGGIALDVSSHEQTLQKIEMLIGTHPLPSEANTQATKHIIEFLSERGEEDLIIMLISGGGSTLLCFPEEPMVFADESDLFKKLTSRGATIQDLNTVRKHLSAARGGGLARAAYPAEIISMIVSDVPGNDISFISSGPTIRDNSNIHDAKEILEKYNVVPSENVVFIETPKEEKYFERVTNIVFLTSGNALLAMSEEAARRGYSSTIVEDNFFGEAREIGLSVVKKLHDAPPKSALFYAGESTVTFDSSTPLGSGGRNQEMALATLENIKEDELILPFASDGHDNTDHAGAICDRVSCEHAEENNISTAEYLDAHNSYEFFSKTGDALVTGYTGSNVSDLIIAIKK